MKRLLKKFKKRKISNLVKLNNFFFLFRYLNFNKQNLLKFRHLLVAYNYSFLRIRHSSVSNISVGQGAILSVYGVTVNNNLLTGLLQLKFLNLLLIKNKLIFSNSKIQKISFNNIILQLYIINFFFCFFFFKYKFLNLLRFLFILKIMASVA